MKIGKQGDSCCCTLVIQLALKFLCLYKSSFVAELAMPAQTISQEFVFLFTYQE
jgi:hypothetical protein